MKMTLWAVAEGLQSEWWRPWKLKVVENTISDHLVLQL